MSAHSMCGMVHSNGSFIPYRNPANLDLKPGTIPKHGNMLGARIAGVVSVWTKKRELYLHQRALLLPIFTEAKELVRIFLPIAYWPSMRQRESGSGIFRQCIMTYGTGTCLLRRYWLPSIRMGKSWR